MLIGLTYMTYSLATIHEFGFGMVIVVLKISDARPVKKHFNIAHAGTIEVIVDRLMSIAYLHVHDLDQSRAGWLHKFCVEVQLYELVLHYATG